jgi:tryptophan synthase alpha subunit
VANWIGSGTLFCQTFPLRGRRIDRRNDCYLTARDIILDCLPGSQAPRIAEFAKDYELHYANLTEYVAETEKIKTLAKDATTGFILQTGLAPVTSYSQTDFSTILYRF